MQKEKKEKPEFKGVKDFILCTNINCDIVELEEKGIKVEEITGGDDLLEMKHVKKTAIRYKLSVDNTHEFGIKLYEELKATSDLHMLAKALVKRICDKKTIILKKNSIFKSYHKALIEEKIIEKKKKGKKYIGKFHEKFINYNIQDPNDPNNDPGLSESARNLRKILQKYLEVKGLSVDEDIEMNLSNTFGKGLNSTCEEGQLYLKPKLPKDYIDNKEIKDFFDVLVFAVNQPNEVELTEIIKDEIGKKFNLIDSNSIYANIQEVMLNWFKEKGAKGKEGRFFLDKDGKELFTSIKRQISKSMLVSSMLEYRAKMNKFGIKFTQDIINELELNNFLTKNNSQIFIFVTEHNTLSAIKLSQVLQGVPEYKKYDSYIFKRLSSLVRIQKHVIEAFKLESNNLLVIECEEDKSIKKEDIRRIRRKLSKIINKKENFNKKIVLITKQGNALANLFKKYHYNCQETTDNNTSFTDLTTVSQEEQLHNFITKDNTQIFILVTDCEYNTLSAIKLFQILQEITEYKKDDSYIFIRLSSLLHIQKHVIKAFTSESNNLLIIECKEDKSIEEKDIQGVQCKLSEIINKKENFNKKIVLITNKQGNALANLFKKYHYNCQETRDNNTSFTDLTIALQKKLLQECKIILQGYKISLNELIDEKDERLKELIDSTTLVKLINNDKITIGHELISLGDTENYYIPRTFNYQTVIKIEIFKKKDFKEEKDKYLLAISDIDEARLRRLVPKYHKISLFQEYGLDKSNDNRSIILNNGQAAEQFKQLCQHYPALNIHWLKSESDQLIWQQSQGSISGLHQYIDERNTEKYSENKFLSQTDQHKVVIISDTAGMGKTTVLTSLSQLFKQQAQDLWIVRIDLNNYTKELKDQKVKSSFETEDIDKAIAFLSNDILKLGTLLDQAIFKSYIQKMIVMFDGFDEISPDYTKIVIELVNVLRNSTIKQLWVTTRPNERDKLEDNLQQLSYKLKPFSPGDQVKFMTKFWQQTSGLSEVTQEQQKELTDYAEALIGLLANSIRYKKDTELTGIPLQTRMLAEAFEQNFAELFKANEAKLQLPEKLDLTDLYECFLKKKYNIRLEKSKLDISQPFVIAHSETEYSKFIEKHQNLALYTLFPENKVEMLLCEKFYQEFSKEYPNLAKKVLRTKNNKKLLFEDKKKKLLTFIDDIKKSKKNTGIIDQIIEDKPHFIHRTFAEYLVGKFLVASLDNETIFKFVLQEILLQPAYQVTRVFLNAQLPEPLPENTLARYGKQIDRLWQSDKENLYNKEGMTLLHLAAEEDTLNIIRFVLSSLKGHETILKSLIEATTYDSYDYDSSDSDSFDPVSYFHDIYNYKTALYLAAEKGYLNVVQCLVEHGADVNHKSDYGMTVLHWAARGNLNVVQWLVEHGKVNVEATEKFGLTALHWAAEEHKWDVVQFLVEHGADVNAKNQFGETVLHWAVQENKKNNLDVVKWLVEHGADVNATKIDGRAVLSWAAQGNLDVVQWLVEYGKANVEATDNDDKTVLHYAAQENKLDVVQWLVEHGKANVDAIDNDSMTVLHHSARYNELDVVQWLVEHGKANVKATDKYGKTPLNLAEERKHKKITEYLKKRL